MQQNKKNKKNILSKIFYVLFAVIVVVLIVGGAGYFYQKTRTFEVVSDNKVDVLVGGEKSLNFFVRRDIPMIQTLFPVKYNVKIIGNKKNDFIFKNCNDGLDYHFGDLDYSGSFEIKKNKDGFSVAFVDIGMIEILKTALSDVDVEIPVLDLNQLDFFILVVSSEKGDVVQEIPFLFEINLFCIGVDKAEVLI